MDDLAEKYANLPNADAREAFWDEIREIAQFFTEAQRELFAISWKESMRRAIERADLAIQSADRALNRAA